MPAARTLIFGATLAILTCPAAAFAQSQSSMQPAPEPAAPPTMPSPATTPSATAAGMDASGVTLPATQFPPAQAQALAQGDNTLVTNGPVPDTPANRAKYQPLSHAGKTSAPEGN